MAEVGKETNVNGANVIKPKTFARLVKTINTSLRESQNSIDTHAAVEKCYGDDASIFGEKESATDMLANLITGTIEHVNERIKEEIKDILRNEKVDSKLLVLDMVTNEQRRLQWTQKEAEDEDRRSVQEALKRSKLPDGITVDNLLDFQAYTIKTQARDDILGKIGNRERENQALRDQIEEEKRKIRERIESMDGNAEVLDKTANMCSFHGIS